MLSELDKLKDLKQYINYDTLFGVEYQDSDSFFKHLSLDFHLYSYSLIPSYTKSLEAFSKNETSIHRSHSRIIRELNSVKNDIDKNFNYLTKIIEDIKNKDIDQQTVIFALNHTTFLTDALLTTVRDGINTINFADSAVFSKPFKDKIRDHVSEYKLYANYYKADTNEQFEEIDKTIEKFEKFDFYKKFVIELKELESSILEIKEKASNINEKSKQLEQDFTSLLGLVESTLNLSHDNNNFYNNKDHINFYQTMKTQGVFDNTNILLDLVSDVYFKTINTEGYIPATEAEIMYLLNKKEGKSSELANFVEAKRNQDAIQYVLDIEDHPKYSSLIRFNDVSLILKDKNNKLILIKDAVAATPIIHDIFNNVISNKLKKNPFVAKEFKNALENRYFFLEECLSAINTFVTNENILKANSYNVIEELKHIKDFETIDDKMNECVLNHKIKKYANSIISNKYKHLYDDESYLIIKGLYELNIEKSILQDMIGKKLSAFHNTEALNAGLNKLLNSFSSFTLDKYVEKANNENVPIVYNKNSILVLEIKDFEKSNLLGSNSWCISRSSHYFSSYTKDGNRQYFIYNFNKSIKDINSMIGLTLEKDGSYNTAHLKNDDHKITDNFLYGIQLNILQNQIDTYPELLSELKEDISSLKKEASNKKQYLP